MNRDVFLDNVKKSSSNRPPRVLSFLESHLPRPAGAERQVGQAGQLGDLQNR